MFIVDIDKHIVPNKCSEEVSDYQMPTSATSILY